MAIHLELPWPPSSLSPNTRHGHWASKSTAAKRYRDACCIATLEATRSAPAAKVPMRVALEFHPPPDHRKRDRDNLVARMKSGLDGVAQALRIDDAQFVEVSARVGEPASSKLLARVSVAITVDEQPAVSH